MSGLALVFSHLWTGQNSTVVTLGDSTVEGLYDNFVATPNDLVSGGVAGGWSARLAYKIGINLNVNVQYAYMGTSSIRALAGWSSLSTLYTSTLGGAAPTLYWYNAGVGGSGLGDDESYLTSYTGSNSNNILKYTSGADAIFIGDGFNDLGYYGTSASTYASQYQTFVSNIQSAAPGVPIIITTENQTDDADASTIYAGVSAMVTAFTGQSWPLSTPYVACSSVSNAIVLDTWQAFNGLTLSTVLTLPGTQAYDWHPNPTGYQTLANWIYGKLLPGDAPAALGGQGSLTATAKGRWRPGPLAGRGGLAGVVTRTSGTGMPYVFPFKLGYGDAIALKGIGVLAASVTPRYRATPTGHGALTATAGPFCQLPYALPFQLGYSVTESQRGLGVLKGVPVPKISAYLTGHGLVAAGYKGVLRSAGALSVSTIPKLGRTAMLAGAGHASGIGDVTCAVRTSSYGQLTASAVTPVVYDATGPGFTSNGTSQASWVHTAASGAYVVVQVLSTPAPTAVFYDGAPMALLGEASVSSGFGSLTFYGLGNVARSGNITVAWPWAAQDVVANSTSYTSVGGVGAMEVVSGQYSYTSKQGRISCPAQGMIVQAFAGVLTANSSVYLTNYTGGTMRWTSQINQYTSGPTSAMCIVGDSPKRSAFSADLFGIGRIGYTWTAVAVALTPA